METNYPSSGFCTPSNYFMQITLNSFQSNTAVNANEQPKRCSENSMSSFFQSVGCLNANSLNLGNLVKLTLVVI